MFTDVNISEELQKKFTDYTAENNIDLGINFSIMVLQVSCCFMHEFILHRTNINKV